MLVQFRTDLQIFYKGIHNVNPRFKSECIPISISTVLSIALFAISCVLLSNLQSPFLETIRGHMGWITCGVAAGSLMVYLIAGGYTKRFIGLGKEVAQGVTLLAIGILGGLGVINPVQVAYGVIGTYITTGVLLYGCGPCLASCSKKIGEKAGNLNDKDGSEKLLENTWNDSAKKDSANGTNGHSEA